MKTKVFILVSMFLTGTLTVSAQSKTESFDVKGNCSLCEKRIETAAKSVKGVSLADWNQETRILEIRYDPTKTNVDKVQMAIAGAGHDTPLHKASNEAYNKLPACCHYDRSDPKEKKDESPGHSH